MEKDWKKIALDVEHNNQEARIQAAFHLENLPDDDSTHILGKGLLTDPSPIVRHEFAFSLGETANPKIASKYLMEAVEKDKNVFVVHEALLALATLGKEEYIPFITKYITHKIPEIAESAEIALQRIKFTSS